MKNTDPKDNQLSAIILAGGDGARLSALTRTVVGEEIPKQFFPLLTDEMLLEQTLNRVSLIVPPSRTVTVLMRQHERFYKALTFNRGDTSFAIQPANRETAPAILFALFRLINLGQQGAVAIFPSDHYVSNDLKFMSHVEAAAEVVAVHPARIVLLGIPPDRPETQYGWIEPEQPMKPGPAGLSDVLRIRRFWEKPSPELAMQFWKCGFFWNSFVLVSQITALIDLFARALPRLYIAFAQAFSTLGTADESEAIDRIYSSIGSESFADRILVEFAQELSVLPVRGVTWNDLGDPMRVLAVVEQLGIRPRWLAACRHSSA
jgi:mannose-1-phosphate guanylyltransferase